MLFLLAEIQGTNSNRQLAILQAWVNCESQEQALTILNKRLATEGWKALTILECSETQQDDYFPPCKSLDAFHEAEKEGIALRYS